MQGKFERKRVELSFRRFNDFASDVLDSEKSTFDSNLSIFINHCENDEVISTICNQLKYDMNILDKWWSENDMNGFLNQLGSKNLNLPLNEIDRVALFYQICLKVNTHEIDLLSFCMRFTSNTGGLLSFFNKVVVRPMVRSISYEIDKITYDIETDFENERYIPITVFNVYLDSSTTVNGDVNTKGDAAIGEGASIEKKKLI